MAVETKVMTADELMQLPRGRGQRHELVRGELRTMPPAGADHGDVAMAIGVSLGGYVRAHKLGKAYAAETGFVISRDPDTVRAPDAAFVRAERAVKSKGFFPGPPDLAVEVVSPNDTYSEVEENVHVWLAAGTRMVIVVDPDTQAATIHTAVQLRKLGIDDAIDGGDVVPGWRLPLRELFA